MTMWVRALKTEGLFGGKSLSHPFFYYYIHMTCGIILWDDLWKRHAVD